MVRKWGEMGTWVVEKKKKTGKTVWPRGRQQRGESGGEGKKLVRVQNRGTKPEKLLGSGADKKWKGGACFLVESELRVKNKQSQYARRLWGVLIWSGGQTQKRHRSGQKNQRDYRKDGGRTGGPYGRGVDLRLQVS